MSDVHAVFTMRVLRPGFVLEPQGMGMQVAAVNGRKEILLAFDCERIWFDGARGLCVFYITFFNCTQEGNARIKFSRKL